MQKRLGRQSILFQLPPVITTAATIVGPKEGEGQLGSYYDRVMPDDMNNQDSWEKCESSMINWTVRAALQKRGLSPEQLDVVLGGDLLNQLIASHFGVRDVSVPFLGLYGACSTMAEGILLAATLVDGGYAANAVVVVSSHHEASERQYRFPNELGVQRPPTASWTVTGAGAVLLETSGSGLRITSATIGKIVDMGIKDPNNMGAAMAPAAADTLWAHMQDTGRMPADYDMIYTGDLGQIGKALLIQLMTQKGLDISGNYEDCGLLIYRPEQDVHAGASGCASSAVVLCGYLFRQMQAKKLRRILLIGTGSLHSPISYWQKESIPCIAHAVSLEI